MFGGVADRMTWVGGAYSTKWHKLIWRATVSPAHTLSQINVTMKWTFHMASIFIELLAFSISIRSRIATLSKATNMDGPSAEPYSPENS